MSKSHSPSHPKTRQALRDRIRPCGTGATGAQMVWCDLELGDGEVINERGDRAKRFYNVSAEGERAIEVTEDARSKLGAGMTRKPAWGSS